MTTTLDYDFEGVTRQLALEEGDNSKPMVVLLHGTGGSISDMTTPAIAPDSNYDFTSPLEPDVTLGWRPYPLAGVWSCCALDPKKDVRSWRDLLQLYEFPTAVYSQVDPNGFLARPVDELAVVMQTLIDHAPKSKFVLLAQSRGGLLVRKFLKDHVDLAQTVCTVITLHSPHRGSSLASIADSLRDVIDALVDVVGSVASNALGPLMNMVDSDAFIEMTVGSDFLADLADGEAPHDGIEYYTFGGVSVRLSRIRSWVYTASSAVPQWHWPPFLHARTEIEFPGISPIADSLPNLIDELSDGRGDLLTADARTRLPFAVHQTNPINHAETLWDPILQAQVLRLLGVDVVVNPPDDDSSFWQ